VGYGLVVLKQIACKTPGCIAVRSERRVENKERDAGRFRLDDNGNTQPRFIEENLALSLASHARHVDLAGDRDLLTGNDSRIRHKAIVAGGLVVYRGVVDRRLLEGLAGFEYNAGCWVFRAVVQRVQAAAQVSATGFFLQLEFSGVGQIGTDDAVALLSRNVPGYTMTSPKDPAAAPPSLRRRLPFEQVF
jgi:hypothetical protein